MKGTIVRGGAVLRIIGMATGGSSGRGRGDTRGSFQR